MPSRRHTAALLAVAAALLLAGCVGQTDDRTTDAPFDGDEDPMLTAWTSAGGHCTDDFMGNVSAITRAGDTTTVSYERNVALPDASYSLGHPEFRWVGNRTYRLDVPVERTEKPPRPCDGSAVARYNATMRFRTLDRPWTLEIYHDGERVGTMTGDQNGSGTSASATAGHSVEAGDDGAGRSDAGDGAASRSGSEDPWEDVVPASWLGSEARHEVESAVANGSYEACGALALSHEVAIEENAIRWNGTEYRATVIRGEDRNVSATGNATGADCASPSRLSVEPIGDGVSDEGVSDGNATDAGGSAAGD